MERSFHPAFFSGPPRLFKGRQGEEVRWRLSILLGSAVSLLAREDTPEP